MTNYEEFKAIADDIAEMYANGYAEYAEYFSETFTGIGELSAVTRISDKVYALRRTDVKDPWYTTALKEIAIDAMLAIGEIDVIPAKSEESDDEEFLIVGAKYYCKKPWIVTVLGEDYTQFEMGKVYEYVGYKHFKDANTNRRIIIDPNFPADRYLQKIIEKK